MGSSRRYWQKKVCFVVRVLRSAAVNADTDVSEVNPSGVGMHG